MSMERFNSPLFESDSSNSDGDEPAEKPEFQTNEQISSLRQESLRGANDVYRYQLDGVAVELEVDAMFDLAPDDIAHVKDLYAKREKGEKVPFEFLLVRALQEQRTIEKEFGLPQGTLPKWLRVNSAAKPTSLLMTSEFSLYLHSLAGHKEALEAKGVDEAGVVIDLAGHILHEQMHDPGADPESPIQKYLLKEGETIGEFTTVTTQLSYYLLRNFDGHGSYDRQAMERGIKKIQAGESNERDHDIATAVGVEIIRRRLQEVVTELKSLDNTDKLTNCRELRNKLAHTSRAQLVGAFKNAIADSANKERIYQIIDELRE